MHWSYYFVFYSFCSDALWGRKTTNFLKQAKIILSQYPDFKRTRREASYKLHIVHFVSSRDALSFAGVVACSCLVGGTWGADVGHSIKPGVKTRSGHSSSGNDNTGLWFFYLAFFLTEKCISIYIRQLQAYRCFGSGTITRHAKHIITPPTTNMAPPIHPTKRAGPNVYLRRIRRVKQNKSHTTKAKCWDGCGAMIPGRRSSHQPGNSQSSHHAEALVGVRHKAETPYDQVGEGRHSSDAASAWSSERRHGEFHSGHFKRGFLTRRRNLWAGRRSRRSTSARPSSDPPRFPFSNTWGRTRPPSSQWLQRRCWGSSGRGQLGAGLKVQEGCPEIMCEGRPVLTKVFFQGLLIHLTYHWIHLIWTHSKCCRMEMREMAERFF